MMQIDTVTGIYFVSIDSDSVSMLIMIQLRSFRFLPLDFERHRRLIGTCTERSFDMCIAWPCHASCIASFPESKPEYE